MFTRAAVAVAAGADFVVEGAVDLRMLVEVWEGDAETYFVLLSTKDGGEVVGHGV